LVFAVIVLPKVFEMIGEPFTYSVTTEPSLVAATCDQLPAGTVPNLPNAAKFQFELSAQVRSPFA
jgi:hypothetical protein